MIQYDEKTALFRLRGDTYDYVFALYEGKPEFLHFGNRTDGDLRPLRRYDYKSFSPMMTDEPGARSFNDMALDYSEYGRGDFRTPAVQIAGDGFISTDYRYTGHRIVSAHPEADGLPVFRGGETLELTLSDRVSDSTLTLYYTVYPRALVRRAAITAGRKPLIVRRLASFSLDLKGTYELTGLFGGHASERHRRTWQPQAGKSVIESSRGTSSHQANPFAALACFELFAKPVLSHLGGCTDPVNVRAHAVLRGAFAKKSGGRRLIRARCEGGNVYMTGDNHSSGSLATMIGCNCLIDIPAGSGALSDGDQVEILLL